MTLLQASNKNVKPTVTPKLWLISLTIMIPAFMEVLDTSIANVVLPNISGNLAVTVDQSTWVLTSYLVSNAVILPMTGWFSNFFGRKRFYCTCIIIFTLSSLFCGYSTSLGMLVFFRILQGIGGGALIPISQAILLESFPREKQGTAMAIFGMGIIVAPIIGPLLGGWLADNYSWHWIFFINIPAGIIALLLAFYVISDPVYLTNEKNKRKIDYIGFLFLCIGLAALQIILDRGQTEDWFSSNYIVVLTVITVASLFFIVFWEWYNKSPVVHLRLLKDKNFLMGVISMFMVGFILYGSTMLLPQFLQELLGYSATQSGMALLPSGIGAIVSMPIAGWLLSKKIRTSLLMTFGVVVTSLSLYALTRINLSVSIFTIMTVRTFIGVGTAFLFVPINTISFAFLGKKKINNATGLINLFRNIGGSFGISLMATLLTRRTQFHTKILTPHISNLNPVFDNIINQIPGTNSIQKYKVIYLEIIKQATILSYLDCFYALSIFALILIPIVLFFKEAQKTK